MSSSASLSCRGDSAAAEKALAAGANANTPGQDGNTPLMGAAMFSKSAIVLLLLANSAIVAVLLLRPSGLFARAERVG